MKAKILASVAVELVATSLEREPDSKHLCFRVKNLLEDEVLQFIYLWEVRSASTGLNGVQLVVASSLGGRVPSRYVADEGKSVTFYRNNNNSGLVYLETEDQSDAQGLKNIFTLRDCNFLDGSFDKVAGRYNSVVQLIAAEAWRSLGCGVEPPSMMLSRIEELINHLHPRIEPVPVRKFTHYCHRVAMSWEGYEGGAVDEVTADALVGEHLWYLELFPDRVWRDPGSVSRTHRRLELNARHSDLRTANGEVDPVALIEVTRRKQFVDQNYEPCTAGDNESWRRLCADYIDNPVPVLLSQIPYSIFMQLFQKDSNGIQLGDRVRQEIEELNPTRLPELDAMDVASGLNQRLQSDAERFLSAVSDGGKPALADLVSGRTRRMIERLAYPRPKEFENPLVESVRQLQRFKQHPDAATIATIKLEFAGDLETPIPSAGLFNFLFGSTLKTVSEQSRAADCQYLFMVDDKILFTHTPPALRCAASEYGGGEEEAAEELSWDPVPLRWVASSEAGKVIDSSDVVLWRPSSIKHMALFWFLMVDPDSPCISGVGGCLASEEMLLAGAEWLEPFVARLESMARIPVAPGYMVKGQNPIADRLIDSRGEFHEGILSGGLSVDLINAHFDGWSALLKEVRDTMIPNGARIPVSDAMLMADSISFGSSGRLLFPAHPLRLRWIGRYLDESGRLLFASLSDETGFAGQDGESYLDWLERRCPRELPPVVIDVDGELLYAKSEFSWFEHYTKLESGNQGFGDDQEALSAICARICGYVDAHPYKRDGLSLLLVLPPSDLTAAKLVEHLMGTALKEEGNISLTVAAPRNRWETIARAVESTGASDAFERRRRLFPSRDVAFIEFDGSSSLEASISRRSFDIGIVINVLDGAMQSQQNTEPPMQVPGHFDILLDRTTRMDAAGDGGATSIVMRPRAPDPALDSWGTLVVRENRCRPVSTAQPENTDFIELRLNFSGSAPLFNAMHRSCHWVITLERHVSRRQIESIEAGSPDVLSIQDGIGANGLGTLVVSSRSGRALIESRIARKLRKLVPESGATGATEHNLNTLASAIYNETRWISPHLALNAMGVSRVTEEILGLAVARALADRIDPLPDRAGFAAWISLDEHAEWFGGVGAIRADMCRLSFSIDESGIVRLDVLVIEGKLRQVFDPHGIQQALLTSQFMKDILNTVELSDSRNKIDGQLWRERIFAAVDMCADQARVTFCPTGSCDNDGEILRARIRSEFRVGNYELDSLKAIYSACLWESQEARIESEMIGEVRVVRTSNVHILPLVRRDPINIPAPGNAADVPELPAKSSAHDEVATTSMPETGSGIDSRGADGSAPDEANAMDDSSSAVQAGGNAKERGTMSREALRAMYGEILACFDAHGISVQSAQTGDDPIVEGPASILFKVRPRAGVDPRKLYEKGDALKLQLRLENDQLVCFGIDKGYVTIDVPKSAEQRYFVDASEVWSTWLRPAEALAAPIGEDRFGKVVELNFSSSNSPHLLIGGTTGSGKSEALNTILYGLVRHYSKDELRLLLVDPKGTELNDFQRFGHLEGTIGWDDADAVELLTKAVAEMERRYGLFKEQRVRSLPEFNVVSSPERRIPWWVIVLDEYADLTSDPQAKKDIEQHLKRLAQKARAAGIHVIIATQKPSGEVISTNLRSNLPAQLALRVKSGVESRVIMDEAGAESLNGKGDAYLKSEGKVRRVQCARVDPDTVH